MSIIDETTKKSGIFTKIIEAFIYIGIVNFSYFASMYIDFADRYTLKNLEAYKSIWIVISVGALIILIINKMFQTLKLSKTENIMLVLLSTIMIGILTIFLAFIFRSFALPRTIIIKGFFIQTFLFSIVKIFMKLHYDKNKPIKKVAIFCNIAEKEVVVEKLLGTNKLLKEKLMYISSRLDIDKSKLDGIEKIYIYDMYSSDLLDKHIRRCILRGVQVCIVPKSYELAMSNSNLYLVSDIPLIKINQVGYSFEYKLVKRVIDIVFSLIGIVVTLPIMAIVYICIYISDKGNPIYSQKRVTINNKIFTVYKFRTMVQNAEQNTGAIWCNKNDPRITKVGSFLRKYWLDELPQLFNILKGDMSIVGPRPERPELIEEFSKTSSDFKLRTLVKAGLTGYAQVMAKYETTPEYKLKFDLFYILNASIIFDFDLIVQTGRKMFLRFIRYNDKIYKYDEFIEIWNVKNIEAYDNIIYYKY